MFDTPPDVVGRGLERLVDQFRDKPHLRTLLATYLDALADASRALAELPKLLSVREATGRQLDLLGGDVGQERRGVDDERYRALLRSRSRLNRSSGSIEDILSLGRVLLLPSSLLLRCHRLELELDAYAAADGFATDIATAAKLLASATAAGVQLWLHHFSSARQEAFGFDAAAGFDVGRFGASVLAHPHTEQ